MKRYTEAERKQFISQFNLSGMKAGAFCRAHGISAPSLSLWRRRYGQSSATGSAPTSAEAQHTPPWVPVVLRSEALNWRPDSALAPADPARQALRYRLVSTAACLEVPCGFDAREVAALWQLISRNALGTEVLP